MTDSQDIENGYETKHGWWLTVEYKSGEVTVFALDDKPLSLSPLRERFGREGSDLEMVSKMKMSLGWCARLDEAGYLDCTDWLGPYESIEQATEALADDLEVE